MSDLGKKRLRLTLSLINFLLLIPAVLVMGLFFKNFSFVFVALIILLLALVSFFLLFENKKVKARELVPIAIMIAIAVVGRAAFYFVPQFKAIVAIVIITGVAFGAEAGFLSGALSMLCSNFMFGQGPWTPWQMFALGIIGYISGFFGKREFTKKTWVLCIWGFVACFIYGWFVDTWSLIGFSYSINWKTVVALYSLGAPFSLILAVSTVLFMALLTRPLLEKLERIKIKYGLVKTIKEAERSVEAVKTKPISGFMPPNDNETKTSTFSDNKNVDN